MSRDEREKLIAEALQKILKDLTIGEISQVEILIQSIPDEKLKKYLKKD